MKLLSEGNRIEFFYRFQMNVEGCIIRYVNGQTSEDLTVDVAEFTDKHIGDTYTAYARQIEGYLPTETSKTITLESVNMDDNIIEFIYYPY